MAKFHNITTNRRLFPVLGHFADPKIFTMIISELTNTGTAKIGKTSGIFVYANNEKYVNNIKIYLLKVL